jgi:hypothetical protein
MENKQIENSDIVKSEKEDDNENKYRMVAQQLF